MATKAPAQPKTGNGVKIAIAAVLLVVAAGLLIWNFAGSSQDNAAPITDAPPETVAAPTAPAKPNNPNGPANTEATQPAGSVGGVRRVAPK